MSDTFTLIAGVTAAVLVYAVASTGSPEGELATRVATACIAVGTAFVVGFGAALAVF